jgi:hypothetical protein
MKCRYIVQCCAINTSPHVPKACFLKKPHISTTVVLPLSVIGHSAVSTASVTYAYLAEGVDESNFKANSRCISGSGEMVFARGASGVESRHQTIPHSYNPSAAFPV